MSDLDFINFEIDNLKKQMSVLFLVGSEELKNELLEELQRLIERRDKLLKKDAKPDRRSDEQ